MILPLLAFFCSFQEEHSLDPVVKLFDPKTHKQTGLVQERADPLQVPEKSPKTFGDSKEHWVFNWQTVGYESLFGPKDFARFSVFSQDRRPENEPAVAVTRMLQRLWEYNYAKLGIDHSAVFGDGVIEVFLCNGGIPGGEQLFDEDDVNGAPHKVNTIYLYDLPTFKDPLEMAREVAHEYGHATLTGVGGYTSPEDWANGFLGEKLFLKHIAEEMRAQVLEPADAMGLQLADLERWLKQNVVPLVQNAAEKGPNLPALRARDAKGMDYFIGLALYVDTVLPESIFRRSLELMPSSNAEDYPEAVMIAAEEKEKYNLSIPTYLRGENLWIPMGDGRVIGAKILKRANQWAWVQPTEQTVTVIRKASAS